MNYRSNNDKSKWEERNKSHSIEKEKKVEGDIDQISQQQTLHDDESEAIDNAKSCISEIEPDRKSTAVEVRQ